MKDNKNKNPRPNVSFEPVRNLTPNKFWKTILSIVCGLLAVAVSFFAQAELLFIIPMVVFSGLGIYIHQKTYKDTLKTNNLAQAALILNLLIVIYILIRMVTLMFSVITDKLF